MIAIPPWYATVPKKPAANRQYRIDMLKDARGSKKAQRWLKDACRDDTLFYFNAFVWTYDPRLRAGSKALPFITYGDQDVAIRQLDSAIDRGRDALIEKSRDRGATWICTTLFEKRWHFHRDETFMVISRDADEVDKPGYPDCLFWKMDFVHRNMPAFMMPKGYRPSLHRRRMTLENPELGSTINGESTVAGAGVGGRRTAMLFDEFARIEEAFQMLLGTADVSPCRIFNSTPYGTGNAFHELTTRDHIMKIRLHWSADPRKNRKMYQWDGERQRIRFYQWSDEKQAIEECPPHIFTRADDDGVNYDPPRIFEPNCDGVLRSPVYDKEDTRRGNRQAMAINWDIDYGGSDYGFFDKKMLLELNQEFCTPPFWEGDIDVDPTTGEITAWKERKSGPLRLWCDLTPEGGLPTAEKGYAAGSDISRGTGASNSCTSIADVLTGHKVCEYARPDEKPEMFVLKTVALCKAFRNHSGYEAMLAWERSSQSVDYDRIVMEVGLSNLYYHGAEASKDFSQRRKPGWPPMPAKNLDELLNEYQVALRQRRFINHSAVALGELTRFMQTPQGVKYVTGAGRKTAFGEEDPTGAREAHGDRGVADALACLAVKASGGAGMPETERRKKVDPADVKGTLAWRFKQHETADLEAARWS